MSDTAIKEKTQIKIKEPSEYNVIYLNDETTSMEFVIESLVRHFAYDHQSAYDRTMQVHTDGSAVVATFPYEIAEQKSVEVTTEALRAGYPLQIKVEEE